MTVVPLVLGILSIVFNLFGLSVLGLPCGIVGLVFGYRMRKEDPQDKMILAGFICSIPGTAIFALSLLASLAVFVYARALISGVSNLM